MNASESLIAQALELMLAGMGTVFLFLVLLVFATRCLSYFASMIQGRSVAPPDASSGVSDQELAAAAAAVARYRQDH